MRKAAGGAGSKLLKEEVTEADIAEIISKWTGERGGLERWLIRLPVALSPASTPQACPVCRPTPTDCLPATPHFNQQWANPERKVEDFTLPQTPRSSASHTASLPPAPTLFFRLRDHHKPFLSLSPPLPIRHPHLQACGQ